MKNVTAKIVSFAGFYAICFIIQYCGAYFTQLSVHDWYLSLHRSPYNPPGMVFGIAWTTLYALMALAATRIYHKTKTLRCPAIRWWFIQLILGLLWSIMFFGQHSVIAGMQIILANLIAVAITLLLFQRIDHKAAWLMLPLLFWLIFASYLNYFILTHN